ncbi:DUF1254 domain-containing protein [Parvibaculum sp.]|uniref:DUF1254 domain-containing protein n=1 Tax=Parvibaculum sp. TaxID=2024848 RepID=UPI001B236E70|nr:DUF1254 domain-containing protein [Parvibaculum sp.]MBO6667152.1 DUF1254 domain-containing protein [Parvibaculum sp.]MBO6693076.1 DUF1254 domain-containing protein [Parvibaculum sp.]MBO6713705.1 DUF1254 domain-containing protein [Parvibaculum sp.]|tara:strand:- start:4190 stop:4711 length:522 start_codon:yes stop_codon:yes gene_type:complete
MKTWPIWLAGTIALAAVFHILTVFGLPYGIMNRAMAGIASQAGGVNKPLYPERATAESRGIVRPSPDLLYTACVYDVSVQPVKLSSPVPDTYWSLSTFASNTDNFFVVNDREVKSNRIEIILAANEEAGSGQGIPVIVAPSSKGIVLFRSLVPSEDLREEIDAKRREANCEPL